MTANSQTVPYGGYVDGRTVQYRGMFGPPRNPMGETPVAHSPAYLHQDLHGPLNIGEMQQSVLDSVPTLFSPLNPKALAELADAMTPPFISIYATPRSNWESDN